MESEDHQRPSPAPVEAGSHSPGGPTTTSPALSGPPPVGDRDRNHPPPPGFRPRASTPSTRSTAVCSLPDQDPQVLHAQFLERPTTRLDTARDQPGGVGPGSRATGHPQDPREPGAGRARGVPTTPPVRSWCSPLRPPHRAWRGGRPRERHCHRDGSIIANTDNHQLPKMPRP